MRLVGGLCAEVWRYAHSVFRFADMVAASSAVRCPSPTIFRPRLISSAVVGPSWRNSLQVLARQLRSRLGARSASELPVRRGAGPCWIRRRACASPLWMPEAPRWTWSTAYFRRARIAQAYEARLLRWSHGRLSVARLGAFPASLPRGRASETSAVFSVRVGPSVAFMGFSACSVAFPPLFLSRPSSSLL